MLPDKPQILELTKKHSSLFYRYFYIDNFLQFFYMPQVTQVTLLELPTSIRLGWKHSSLFC